MDEPVDLFEDQESLPKNVQKVIDYYSQKIEEGDGNGYLLCKEFLHKMESLGYTFDYGLDGVPYGLEKLPSGPAIRAPGQ